MVYPSKRQKRIAIVALVVALAIVFGVVMVDKWSWEVFQPHLWSILLVILTLASLVGGVMMHIHEEERSAMRKEEFEKAAE